MCSASGPPGRAPRAAAVRGLAWLTASACCAPLRGCRLQSELMALMMSGEAGLSAFPDGDNIFQWTGTITGGAGTVRVAISREIAPAALFGRARLRAKTLGSVLSMFIWSGLRHCPMRRALAPTLVSSPAVSGV